jgi:hypothetical protein
MIKTQGEFKVTNKHRMSMLEDKDAAAMFIEQKLKKIGIKTADFS